MRRSSCVARRVALVAALTMSSGAQAPAAPLPCGRRRISRRRIRRPSDHFGCGGEVQGHNGPGRVAQRRRQDAGGGRAARSQRCPWRQRQSGRQLARSMPAPSTSSHAPATAWAQQAYLKPSNPQTGAEFGHYVALSADGNTLAVSAYWEASNATGINGNQKDESIPQAGAVYVFTRQGSTWRQQAYIKASNTGEAGTADSFGEGDQFGFSLALSGDGNTIAVGALTEDSAATGINGDQRTTPRSRPAPSMCSRAPAARWSQQAYVKPSNIDAGDFFGYSVSLNADGTTLAVGAFDEDGSGRGINPPPDNRAAGSGAAYVFTRAGTSWAQQAYIKASNSESQDSFGVHVALSDDGSTLLVGSLDEDCTATGVNARGCDNDWNDDLSMGAAYVFVRSGATWSQQAFLKPSNTGPNDWFGARVALSGDGNTAAIARAERG